MIITQIIIFFIACFIGYVVGRWGDNYVNFWMRDPKWTPHHWIYGALLMAVAFFIKDNLNFWVFSFGLGVLVSDLKDFMKFKIIGSDNKNKEKVKFWNID